MGKLTDRIREATVRKETALPVLAALTAAAIALTLVVDAIVALLTGGAR